MKKLKMKTPRKRALGAIMALLLLILIGYDMLTSRNVDQATTTVDSTADETFFQEDSASSDGTQTDGDIPSYSGQPYAICNDNMPEFSAEEMTDVPFTELSELDELGRCGTAIGCFGRETVTNQERGSIGHIRPSGWHTVKYPGIISDLYLYNRCHLLMFKLSGILDDERNLITGTRYMNTEGMLPFENSILDYIEETGNHVMYRVTPVFVETNLVASGVQMEAYSVEDQGKGICFNVFCFNVQPNIEIDYRTGDSRAFSEGNAYEK